jgi:hypothetical protein
LIYQEATMTLALSQPAPLFSPSDQPYERDSHYERLFWLACMADGDATALAKQVLDRLQLDARPKEEDALLLDIEVGDRRRIEIYFSTLASRRLLRRSLDQRCYARTIGHPINAPREAFEAGGEHEIAAAYCALVHDKLADSTRAEVLTRNDATLRFSVARLLASVRPESAAACRRLATRTLDRLSEVDQDGVLGEAIRSWLGAALRPMTIEVPLHAPATPVAEGAEPALAVESLAEDALFEDPRFGVLQTAAQSFL